MCNVLNISCMACDTINIQSNATVLHYMHSTQSYQCFYYFISVFWTDCAGRARLLCTEGSVSYVFSALGAIYSSFTGKLHTEMMPQTLQQGHNIQLSQHLFSSLTSATLGNGPSRVVSLSSLTLNLKKFIQSQFLPGF